jgi:hypothetical protein
MKVRTHGLNKGTPGDREFPRELPLGQKKLDSICCPQCRETNADILK